MAGLLMAERVRDVSSYFRFLGYQACIAYAIRMQGCVRFVSDWVFRDWRLVATIDIGLYAINSRGGTRTRTGVAPHWILRLILALANTQASTLQLHCMLLLLL